MSCCSRRLGSETTKNIEKNTEENNALPEKSGIFASATISPYYDKQPPSEKETNDLRNTRKYGVSASPTSL